MHALTHVRIDTNTQLQGVRVLLAARGEGKEIKEAEAGGEGGVWWASGVWGGVSGEAGNKPESNVASQNAPRTA